VYLGRNEASFYGVVEFASGKKFLCYPREEGSR